MNKSVSIVNQLDFLSGGGEMGERIRNFDWSHNPLGNPETWEQGLKTCVRIILTSAQPMFVWWGPSRINIYNDSYAKFLGKKHPAGLGAKAEDVWKEVWELLVPKIESVERNEGTYDDSMLFIMERKGYQEEVYVSFCYSPAPGDDGMVKGLFCVCADNSERIINERGLQTLRDLGAVVFDDKSLDVIYRNVADVLEKNNKDFPFAVVYKLANNGKTAVAVATTDAHRHSIILPAHIDIESPTDVTRGFCQAYETNHITVTELKHVPADIPKGFWKKSASQFVYIPICAVGSSHPYAIIFAALNPFRQFDKNFHQFCELLGERVSLEINKMLALEEERKRVEALEEIDKAKTVFFSNISHEFRTPLTLILSPLEELLNQYKKDLSFPERQHIETAHRNAMRLLKLVNTLLDFSRIESGRQQANYVLTDINMLTANLAANFRAVIEKAGLKLIVKTDTVIQPVYVDQTMWEKIVFNLLSNAFKYTLAGSITVTLTAEDKFAVLRIKDTGVGIPESELPRMFERFHRVQQTTGRTFEGTGIGLSLIKELVSMHKGDISVESKLNEGSTFTVRVPFGKDHLPQEQITTGTKEEPLISGMYVEEAGTLLVKDKAPETTIIEPANNLPLVLVVDDNADMREHLQSVLAQHFKVITAENGLAALHKVQTHQPALVLSDIMIPVLDGIGLLKEMKGNPVTAQIPIILLTARAGEESTIAGWETGADDYLVKPFSSKELLARITAHIKTQRIRNEALQRAEQSSAELRELSASLEQKVNRRTKELDETNRELRRMNEELTEFAYVSSHDLQEPLRKIQMFSKRILEKEFKTMSADAQQLLVRMDNAARRMQLLINDLLTYSRTNTTQKHFVRTDLNDLLNEVKQELYETITATDTIIESDPLPKLPIIAFQFKQLFTNLIVNSIKFACKGVPPHITIINVLVDGRAINHPLAKPEKRYWHLSFMDNGTGFDPQFKEQIFGVFQRLHDKVEYEGTGIGLAIAKKVVENHDGIIAADGEKNKGATIHIFLPEL